MRLVGSIYDLKQTIALPFVGNTKHGKTVLAITTGFFGGSKGVGTINCASTKQDDVWDFETLIIGIQGITETTDRFLIQDRIITCCTNSRVVIRPDICYEFSSLTVNL